MFGVRARRENFAGHFGKKTGAGLKYSGLPAVKGEGQLKAGVPQADLQADFAVNSPSKAVKEKMLQLSKLISSHIWARLCLSK